MKKLMLICAPVTSRSGYGDHARDLVRAFLKLDKFNIKIIDVTNNLIPIKLANLQCCHQVSPALSCGCFVNGLCILQLL